MNVAVAFTFRPIERWPGSFTKPRRRSPFSVGYSRMIRDLSREIDHIGAQQAVIQAAVSESEVRLDGLLRAGASPQHPGIILAFESKKTGPMQMPCDTYLEWPDNLRAIGLSLSSLRAIDRYGVTQRAEQYRGWSQLPPPGGLVTPPRMNVDEAARFMASAIARDYPPSLIMQSADNFKSAYRKSASILHPDVNGGQQRVEWSTLQVAAQVLRAHHGLRE